MIHILSSVNFYDEDSNLNGILNSFCYKPGINICVLMYSFSYLNFFLANL